MTDTFETLTFFRGMSGLYPTDKAFVKTPRKDRRPKDSSMFFHTTADAWFQRQFGVRYRSHGVFVTSRRMTAEAYAASPAHVVRVIPTTPYRYCWSPAISDLLFRAKALAGAGAPEIERMLESAEYKESELRTAHDVGNEVMLFCEQYVAIPVAVLGMTVPSAPSGILLPG